MEWRRSMEKSTFKVKALRSNVFILSVCQLIMDFYYEVSWIVGKRQGMNKYNIQLLNKSEVLLWDHLQICEWVNVRLYMKTVLEPFKNLCMSKMYAFKGKLYYLLMFRWLPCSHYINRFLWIDQSMEYYYVSIVSFTDLCFLVYRPAFSCSTYLSGRFEISTLYSIAFLLFK